VLLTVGFFANFGVSSVAEATQQTTLWENGQMAIYSHMHLLCRNLFLGVVGPVYVCSSLVSAQPCPVTWGTTQQISNTAHSAFGPSLTVVGDTIHTVYLAGSLYYRRSLDKGTTWDQQVEIVPDDSMSGQIWNRPLAASGGNVYVVWGNGGASITSVKIRRSTDAGASWLEPQVLARGPVPDYYTSPVVAAYGEDVYVAVFDGVQLHVSLVRSTDYGVTWDSVRQITFGAEGHGVADIAASPAGVHIVGGRFETVAEVGYVVSTDRGLTWSTSQVLSTIDNYRAWWPEVAADDAGNVYSCWQDAKYGSIGGFAGTVILRKSTDNGATWSPETNISPLPSAGFSSIAVNGMDVHIVWDDERNGVDNGTIQYRHSSDGGGSWCNEVTVGDTLDLDIDASVAATPERVHIAWSSRALGGHADIYCRSGILKPTSVLPTNDFIANDGISLGQNYPNPFNNQTTVQYTIARTTQIRLSVYDVLGREVILLRNGTEQPGERR
jgi:hypothetical protein